MLFNEAVPMQSDTARCGTHPLRTHTPGNGHRRRS
ncbi:MAG: hypothetical protein QOG05_3375 [Streptosporangiaceae bacterium]|jgi:hypothetical protein|nr:hypothetical protein [Streptosporangiaceae bacterium]